MPMKQKEPVPAAKPSVAAPAMTAKKGRGPDKRPRKKPLANYFGGR